MMRRIRSTVAAFCVIFVIFANHADSRSTLHEYSSKVAKVDESNDATDPELISRQDGNGHGLHYKGVRARNNEYHQDGQNQKVENRDSAKGAGCSGADFKAAPYASSSDDVIDRSLKGVTKKIADEEEGISTGRTKNGGNLDFMVTNRNRAGKHTKSTVRKDKDDKKISVNFTNNKDINTIAMLLQQLYKTMAYNMGLYESQHPKKGSNVRTANQKALSYAAPTSFLDPLFSDSDNSAPYYLSDDSSFTTPSLAGVLESFMNAIMPQQDEDYFGTRSFQVQPKMAFGEDGYTVNAPVPMNGFLQSLSGQNEDDLKLRLDNNYGNLQKLVANDIDTFNNVLGTKTNGADEKPFADMVSSVTSLLNPYTPSYKIAEDNYQQQALAPAKSYGDILYFPKRHSRKKVLKSATLEVWDTIKYFVKAPIELFVKTPIQIISNALNYFLQTFGLTPKRSASTRCLLVPQPFNSQQLQDNPNPVYRQLLFAPYDGFMLRKKRSIGNHNQEHQNKNDNLPMNLQTLKPIFKMVQSWGSSLVPTLLSISTDLIGQNLHQMLEFVKTNIDVLLDGNNLEENKALVFVPAIFGVVVGAVSGATMFGLKIAMDGVQRGVSSLSSTIRNGI